MHTGELCGNGAVIARDSCSLKSPVTDHRHHPHPRHQVQQQQQATPQLQQCQSGSHQTNAAAVAAAAAAVVARSLQQSCYHRQQSSDAADRAVAPSSSDGVAHHHHQQQQPRHPSAPPQQQRLPSAGGGDHLRHSNQLEHPPAAAAKLIKSEPNESTGSAAVASRELTESKTGRKAVGAGASSVSAAHTDKPVDSQLHSVNSTSSSTSSSSSSSSLNEVISRHYHQRAAEMHQTSGGGSFTVSSLVHPTAVSAGGYASIVDDGLGRDMSADGVLNAIDRGSAVDADSTCFDSSSAAVAAAQWFAATGGPHHGVQQPVGSSYSSRCTQEFYMQRLHAASIAVDRLQPAANSACVGLGDIDAVGHHPAAGAGSGYAAAAAAAWYGAAQPADVICSPTSGSGAYLGGDMFDVSAAATRMLSTRQSCAQLQSASPFRAYYGAQGNPGAAVYAAYAEDCAAGKY